MAFKGFSGAQKPHQRTHTHTHRIHTYMLVYSPHMHGQSDRARGAANLSESKLKQDNRSLVCFARSPSPASSSPAPPRLASPRLACSLCHSHTVVLIHTNLLAIIHCGLSCFELAALRLRLCNTLHRAFYRVCPGRGFN